jgi:DNA-binding beta-propeller fold protein YncE
VPQVTLRVRGLVKVRRAVVPMLVASVFVALSQGSASAAEGPPTLWQNCLTGTGAGQCAPPQGIVANPVTGRVYVADLGNRRIDEFTAWGVFLRAWGWGVRDGSAELQTCTALTGCRPGLGGAGQGEFGEFGSPAGLAIDSSDDLYVVDWANSRVEKFDPTAGANGDEVEFVSSFGSSGTGNGQFSGWRRGSFISVGPGDTVYVGDQNRIQEFDSSGTYLKSVALPGETVQSLAVDPVSGDMYVAYFGGGSAEEGASKEGVRKIGPAGEPICTALVKDPTALAVSAEGELYVAEGMPDNPLNPPYPETELLKFNSACQEEPAYRFVVDRANSYPTRVITFGIAVNAVTVGGENALYYGNGFENRSFVRAYVPPPDKPAPFDQPPTVPPSVGQAFASSVSGAAAEVRARINPHFFKDTTYRVEYGTAPCSGGGCQSQPSPPGTQLTSRVVDEPLTTAPVVLGGLSPETTYHYRFIAQSGGGGPVEGPESTFRTPAEPFGPPSCRGNEALRTGPGSALPDCRAYEMVSPAVKNGGDIAVAQAIPGFLEGAFFQSRLDQARPDGGAITYSASRAFAGAASGAWSSQYIAERGGEGWQTTPLNPPLSNVSLYGSRSQELQFKAFSEDLCSSWVVGDTTELLATGAQAGVPNLYRRSDCGTDSYETLTRVAPPGYGREVSKGEAEGSEYLPEPQGWTAAGCSIFRSNAVLTSNAAQIERLPQLYEACPGKNLRLVSVLPDGEAASEASTLGIKAGVKADFRNDNVAGAAAAGGSRLIWTAYTSGEGAASPGRVFMRVNPTAPQSADGSCDEAGKACTLELAGPGSIYWAAAPDGSRVIVQTAAGELLDVTVTMEGGELVVNASLIAERVEGVMGASRDVRTVYFVSTSELAQGAIAGKPNLYFHQEGQPPRLVATLAASDSQPLEPRSISVDSVKPGFRVARVSPDGLTAAFDSSASLTGYDSTDQASGQSDNEVYLYDARADGGAGKLICASCNPTGALPVGANLAGPVATFPTWVAAIVPGWQSDQFPTHALSDSGERLFFESYDALVPADTDGTKDVYEWERAPGKTRCEELGAAIYAAAAEGCLSLISTGTSPDPSEFIDASADGDDVFFTTSSSLVAQDGGSIDLYDASVDGGFPTAASATPCSGQACQSAQPAPTSASPDSATAGPGNVTPGCRKGTHKVKRHGKFICVKKKNSHHKHKKKQSHKGKGAGK